MTTTEIAPLVVWDVKDAHWWPFCQARADWLAAAGLPTWKMYRVEFFLLDAPFARIFCHAMDENRRAVGHWLDGHFTCVLEDPRDVLLGLLPPEELW